MTKLCFKCDVYKYLTDFYPDKTKKDGRHTVCKECVKSDRRARYAADPELFRQRNIANYYAKGGREKMAERHRGLKDEAIAAYGGRCQCCGETAREFLTIDHKNDDGAEHRKVVRAADILRWLKARGWPQDDFQLLCWNCNCARGIHGVCPHEVAREAVA